jgi:AcrR family transcriptional regulator
VPAERQPDPRIERSRQVILRAALAELGESGYGAFTIESVAARAGVAKSTIYRHWPDRLALIADAFETAHAHSVPPVEALTAREGLQRSRPASRPSSKAPSVTRGCGISATATLRSAVNL